MAAPTETTKAPTEPGPESPTTARPLDLDDDDVQETGILTSSQAPNKPETQQPSTTQATQGEEAPPPKPPRPMTEQEKNERILKEAFPGIEPGVIKAVLTASGGRIEPAFNALLEMTDPDAVQHEPPPPPKPPRPAQGPVPVGSTPLSQLEADEQYARQLAQHYENVGSYEARTSNRGYAPRTSSRGHQPPQAGEGGERERSFLDDDLPVIRENLRKGFVETQTKFNSWLEGVKKKIDEEWNSDEAYGSQQQQAGREPFMGRPTRGGGSQRRSGDYDRYDADPELLSDDFAGIRLHSDGTPVRDQRPTNPNLFKPPPPSSSPKPGADGRKVAFRDTVEDIDMYDRSPNLPPKDTPPAGAGGAKASKWQPLSTIDPSPIAENDPFSLGDSDDEKDAPGSAKKGDAAKLDDAERLRLAAAEAMNDSLVDDKSKATGAGAKKD